MSSIGYPATSSLNAPEGVVSASPTPPAPILIPLTRREQEVISVLAQGLNYREIGATLEISPNTVRAHLHTIYQKMAVNSGTRAILRFREQLRQPAC